MTFGDALIALGVRNDTLTCDEKTQLDCDGFVVLHDMFTLEQAARMQRALDEIFAQDRAGEPGAPAECGNLQNRSDAFDLCLTSPRVLAAVSHVLGSDFQSLGVHSRPNPPGRGHQGLHVDWDGSPAPVNEYCVCNSIWPLVDFTASNGATRVVPGSHRFGVNPSVALTDIEAPHPDEVSLEIPAGSVAVFNSHLWHGATLNRSSSYRPNVTSYWSRRTWPGRELAQNELGPSAAARLSESARRLFTVNE